MKRLLEQSQGIMIVNDCLIVKRQIWITFSLEQLLKMLLLLLLLLILFLSTRRPFAVLHRQYSELVESLTNQIMNYHKHIIATVILQDAESHNWGDQRPFYEVLHVHFAFIEA